MDEADVWVFFSFYPPLGRVPKKKPGLHTSAERLSFFSKNHSQHLPFFLGFRFGQLGSRGRAISPFFYAKWPNVIYDM